MNTFGQNFCFTSFGESHGKAIGGVLDGVPAGLAIDMQRIANELQRRAGKGKEGVSSRATSEADEIEWLSGILDGISTGTPIAFLIRNKDARPEDYAWAKETFRPGHADHTYQLKYGIRDYRGGGRASARETASRVVAGAIAKQLLEEKNIRIEAQLTQIGSTTDPAQFDQTLHEIRTQGDSIGGIITCTIKGLQPGIGEPVFDKLQARLAYAVMSINACKGFEYGTGFEGVGLKGSEANQIPCGIYGGISDGDTITFRCVFKPTPSIAKAQTLPDGSTLQIKGRHDVCVAVRAVPVVEAMTALTIMDLLEEANQKE